MNSRVYFEKINGKKIFCIFTEPDDNQKKVIIMAHGFRGTSVGPVRQFVDFQNELVNHGFSVFRFDQPCSGNSEGPYIESSFTEWVQTLNYFALQFLEKGYTVSFLGQSMGATAITIAAGSEELLGKIDSILLWVPDPKIEVDLNPDEVFEESGQKYQGKFWLEARGADFFAAMRNFAGKIHLVYGEKDRYVSKELRERAMQEAKKLGHDVMLLHGQDHSPWEYDMVQKVYKEEVNFLLKASK